VDYTFIFSHVSVSRAHFLGISCYFFDTLLDDWRQSFLKSIKNASLTFFKPLTEKKKKFQTLSELKRLKKTFFNQTQKKKYKYKYKKQKQKHFIARALRPYARTLIKRFRYKNRYIRPADRFRTVLFRKLPKDSIRFKLLRYYPTILFDRKYYPNPHFIRKKRFKLLKVCIILFQQKIQSWKQQYFLIILMKNLLLSILLCPRFVPPFIFFKLLNSLIIKEFSFKHLNFHYFRKIFHERYLIFQGASIAIQSSIKSFDKNEYIKISFFGMHVRNISASFITNYIIIKLGQYFTIRDILHPVLRRLKNTSYIKGFKIIVAGRITRKERAAYLVRHFGDVTLGTKSCNIDYAADFKIMRFGVVGIKVWFHLTTIRPYYYVFRFSFKK